MDAAQYLSVYDADLIFSWTPREFKNFVKGARLREIDMYELNAANALFTAKAQNSRRKVSLKDLYDGDKVRKQLLTDENDKEKAFDPTLHREAVKSMRNWGRSKEKGETS